MSDKVVHVKFFEMKNQTVSIFEVAKTKSALHWTNMVKFHEYICAFIISEEQDISFHSI